MKFKSYIIIFFMTVLLFAPYFTGKAVEYDYYESNYAPDVLFILDIKQYYRGSLYGVSQYYNPLDEEVYDFVIVGNVIYVYKSSSFYWSFNIPNAYARTQVRYFNETCVLVLNYNIAMLVDYINKRTLATWDTGCRLIGEATYPVNYGPPVTFIGVTWHPYYGTTNLKVFELRDDGTLLAVNYGIGILSDDPGEAIPLFIGLQGNFLIYEFWFGNGRVMIWRVNRLNGEVVSGDFNDYMWVGREANRWLLATFDVNYVLYIDGSFDLKIYFAGYTKMSGESDYTFHGKRLVTSYKANNNVMTASWNREFTCDYQTYYIGGKMINSTYFALFINTGTPTYALDVIWWNTGRSSFVSQGAYPWQKVKNTYYTPCSAGINWLIEYESSKGKYYFIKGVVIIPTITQPSTTTTTFTQPTPYYTTTQPFEAPEAHTQFIVNAIIPLAILLLPAGLMFYLMGSVGAVVGLLIGVALGYSAGFIPFSMIIIIALGIAVLFVYSMGGKRE